MTAPFEFTHDKTHVAFDGWTLTVDGKHFPVDEITRLTRSLLHSKSQGSWNRLTANVTVYANGEQGSVTFMGDASTEEWGPWRPLWDQFYAMVHDEIEARLIRTSLEQLMSGATIELVSLRAAGRGRIEITAEGFTPRRPFAKLTPWASISDVSTSVGVYQLHVPNASGKVKTHLTGVGVAEWDAWQFPLLWQVFHKR